MIEGIGKLYTKPHYSAHRHPVVKTILQCLYIIFVVLGISTNSSVIIALLQHKALVNITNLYIFCLALSDLILCTLAMPGQAYYDIFENTSLPLPFCKIIFTSFGLPLYISCLTMLLIAIDRHRLIIYPLSKRIKRRTAVLLLASIVVFSLINSSPVGIYTIVDKGGYGNDLYSLTDIKSPNYCIESWPSKLSRLVYSILMFTLQFVVPLITSACLYINIYRRLNQRRMFKQKEADRKRRTNRILMMIVVFFTICWAPWCIFSLLLEIQNFYTIKRSIPPLEGFLCHKYYQDRFMKPTTTTTTATPTTTTMTYITTPFDNYTTASYNQRYSHKPFVIISGQYMKLIDLILKLFATFSAVINPFLYGWLNEPIRKSMLKVFQRLSNFVSSFFRSRGDQSHSNNNNNTNKNDYYGLTIVEETKLTKSIHLHNNNNNNNYNNANNCVYNCQYQETIITNNNDPWILNDRNHTDYSCKQIIGSEIMLDTQDEDDIDKCDEYHDNCCNSGKRDQKILLVQISEETSNLITVNNDLEVPTNVCYERNLSSPVLLI